MSNNLSEEKYFGLLNSCEENCKANYCFYKRFLESKHIDLRVLCQFKAVEMFKYMCGEKENQDIGWREAEMRWVTEGYAKAFSQVYEENVGIKEIYRRTEQRVVENNSLKNANNTSNVSNTSDVSNVSSTTKEI